jgi:hypothetical protein
VLLAAVSGCATVSGSASTAQPHLLPYRAIIRIEPPPASSPAVPTSLPVVTVRPSSGLPEGTRIGRLTAEQCYAELDVAGVPYQRLPGPVPGIAMPIRLTGPVGGVAYRNSARTQDTPYTLLDCRLARALVPLSDILRSQGIVEAVHYSMHRPGRRGRWLGGGRTGHNGGLAIDLAVFKRDDGSALSILNQFRGRRRRPVCGPQAAPGATVEARVLREIVCRADEQHLFHVLLTPNHDYAHRNHFHMEVRPGGVKWFILH